MKSKKAHNLRTLKKAKASQKLQMLTCYDYQTARLLDETTLDMILVGDSLGNVILGLPTTVPVQVDDMITFGKAVVRGAPNTFVVVDMPFGSYAYFEQALENAIKIFQKTQCQALKLEGANEEVYRMISALTQHGIPVMGHIGLTPQSVHQMGGYYTHGKELSSIERLKQQAKGLERAGCFSIVLECVTEEVAKEITTELEIPTIGIGSGEHTDGQVLVINDLLKMGPDKPPSFCSPIADLYELKKSLITGHLDNETNS